MSKLRKSHSTIPTIAVVQMDFAMFLVVERKVASAVLLPLSSYFVSILVVCLCVSYVLCL